MDTPAILPPGFLRGANLPWLHYGIDFGANSWRPEGGVAQPRERDRLDRTFDALERDGVQLLRWFLFCDGRAGIEQSRSGRPRGLDNCVFRDVDAALEIARRHGMRVMFVLLDFLLCDTPRLVKGVQLGGRASLLQQPDLRDELLARVFSPLLKRYADEPAIFAWDLINEPEWITSADWIEIDAYLREAAALIHEETSQPVTAGSAGVGWRERYCDIDLDFYQVHWYDRLRHQPALETPVDTLGFDKPVILGEFPSRGSILAPGEILDIARSAGYAGAFYWSHLASDEYSMAL
jgi:hypothetical protein